MANQKVTKARDRIAKVYEQLKAGQDVQEACAQLMAYFQNAQELTEKGQRKNTLFEIVGEKDNPIAQMQWLQRVLEMPEDAFEISFLDRKGAERETKLTGIDKIAGRINTIHEAKSGSLSGELHAINVAMSGKINSHIISTASKKLSNEDAFVLSLTEAVTTGKSQEEISKIVEEAQAKNVNVQSVIGEFTKAYADKIKGLLSGVVVKTPDKQNAPKPKFNIKETIISTWRRFFPKKDRESTKDEKIEGIEVSDAMIDDIAQYISMTKVMDSTKESIEGYVRVRLLAREFNSAVINPTTKEPDISITTHDSEKTYAEVTGVEFVGEEVKRSEEKDNFYAESVKMTLEKKREALNLGSGNPTWDALAKFIDHQGNISSLTEDERKLLSASKILKPLTRKMERVKGKIEDSLDFILNDFSTQQFKVIEESAPENDGEQDNVTETESSEQTAQTTSKKSLLDKIKDAKKKIEGYLTGLISKEEVKDENGLKEPAKNEKTKEEKQGQKQEKKGKVNENYVDKAKKENNFTFNSSADGFGKNIKKYITTLHPDKVNILDFLDNVPYSEKKNSTLKGLMIHLSKVSDAYFKTFQNDPTAEYGFHPLIDGLLETIQLECQNLETAEKYPLPRKPKRFEKTNADPEKEAKDKLAQYKALFGRVREFIKNSQNEEINEDIIKKTLLIFNETLIANKINENDLDKAVQQVKNIESLGITTEMSEMQVLDVVQDFAHSPRMFTKDKDKKLLFKEAINASKKFFVAKAKDHVDDLSTIRMLTEQEFIDICAKSLASKFISEKMSEKFNTKNNIMEKTKSEGYYSIRVKNKDLIGTTQDNAKAIIINCGNLANNYESILRKATLPKKSKLAEIVGNEFDFDKIPSDMWATIEEKVKTEIESLGLLNITDEMVSDMCKETFGPEKANETSEPEETEENATVVDLANIQSEFDGFIANDKSRQNVVADYAAVYSLDRLFNGMLTAMDPKIGYETFLDNEASEEQKIEKVKAVLGDTIRESVGDDQKAFETAVKEIADFGTKYFTAKKAMEVQINEFNDSLSDDKKLADPMSFADKYARAQAIKSLQEKEDRDLEDEELLTSLENEHKAELKKQQKSGKAPLSEVEEKFISNSAEPAKDDDKNVFKPVQVASNYSETFKEVYAEWKELKDKKNPSNEEKERLKKLVQENVDVIVSKMIAEGAKIPDDASKKTVEDAIKSKEVLTDEEREFIGANSNLVDAIKLSTTHYDDFCKAVIAQNGVKQIPHLSATREVDEKGKIKYTYSVTVMKTYEQMYPNTDMSQTIQKSVKDLKDAYVYLKPGIKLCDKLLDYIKTLKFAEVHNKMQNLGKDNGGSGSGNGSGNDNDKDKDKDPQNINENDKIVALLKEINEKLDQFKKQVDLAVAKVESAKTEATKLGAEVSMKIFDASNLLTNLAKTGMDPALLTKYNEENKIYFDDYNKYNRKLLELGPLQFPVQNMGDGTFALWGPYLASMAMMNPAYITPLAGFLNQDPTQFGKVFMQMRHMHLVNVTVTQEVNGAPFTFKVDINLADAYSEDKVAMLKQNINDHIKEFMSSGITKVEVIKADLMAYIDRIAMGSQVGSASLENLATKEKQLLTGKTENEAKEIEGQIMKSEPVKTAPTQDKEHAPKPRFDFVINGNTITITENGKEVISKEIEKTLTPAEKAYLRNELNEIERADFKDGDSEQLFFESMFDKLLENVEEKKVEPTVKSATPVKREGTKEHAPKPRFDFVIKDKTITITENGKEVISKVIDKNLSPAEVSYLRNELNEIERAEFKNAEEVQFFFNAMFDKLLEGTKLIPTEGQSRDEGM